MNQWAITGYWLIFDPTTHRGGFALNLDRDKDPEIRKDNLSAEDMAVVSAILTTGRAVYLQNGILRTEA